MVMSDKKSGFRIEFPENHKIAKRLKLVSIYLRNQATGRTGLVTRNHTRLANRQVGYVDGKWTVRKSGTISFKGIASGGYEVEYVYGKLTIGRNLDKPGHQTHLNYEDTVEAFTKLIDNTFPALSPNLKLNLSVHA